MIAKTKSLVKRLEELSDAVGEKKEMKNKGEKDRKIYRWIPEIWDPIVGRNRKKSLENCLKNNIPPK